MPRGVMPPAVLQQRVAVAAHHVLPASGPLATCAKHYLCVQPGSSLPQQ